MMTKQALTVTELSLALKNCLNLQFPGVCITGVISDLYSGKGYLLFSLTDENSKLKCIQALTDNDSVEIDVGDTIKVKGTLSVFNKSGEFQVLVSKLERLSNTPSSYLTSSEQHAFAKANSRRVNIIEFDSLIRSVGIITSRDGAALSDILAVIKHELGYLHVKVFPTVMQGKNAFDSFENSIFRVQRHKDLDVLIIARGGGSYEDLSIFNSKNLANLLKSIQIPVISAIGHAKDDVFINHVANASVATPTSAIQKIVSNKNKCEIKLQGLRNDLSNAIQRLVLRKRNKIEKIFASPHTASGKIEIHAVSLQLLENKLGKALRGVFLSRQQKLVRMENLLEKLKKTNKKVCENPIIYSNDKKRLIRSGLKLRIDEVISIKFYDGIVNAKVSSAEK
tara:strand:+ start:156 stop:1340 length:1185 start_codon:yes stop_codon:yes gene_type:complete